MKQTITCSKCGKEHIKKDGKRKTENRGKIQRYKCLDCSYRFVLDEGFYRMRNNEKKITAGIDLYYKGVSFRKVRDHFKAFYPHNASPMSVYRWVVKYSKMVARVVDNFQIQCGEEMMSDEVEYFRRIERYSDGREQNWFVDTFDVQTRFMIVGEYMKSRTNENLIKVLKKSKFKTGRQIKVVTTDGLMGYPAVLRATYNLKSQYHVTSRTRSEIVHNVVIASERGFNHPIERLHNTIRERTKIMRGFHGTLESANAIMKGLEINYNFNRRNIAIKNKMPYELAIPELKLGDNKWLDLIRLSKM